MSRAIIVRTVATLVVAGVGLAVADDMRITRITHFEDSSSDRLPTLTAVPQYPKNARRDRIEGEATVCYFIDSKGRIRKPAVRRSSHKMFAKPSMKAIKQSSYEPLRPNQKPSQVKTCRTFRFLLNPVAIDEVE
jgi:TonB family protein